MQASTLGGEYAIADVTLVDRSGSHSMSVCLLAFDIPRCGRPSILLWTSTTALGPLINGICLLLLKMKVAGELNDTC
jgi:hypothetical protein